MKLHQFRDHFELDFWTWTLTNDRKLSSWLLSVEQWAKEQWRKEHRKDIQEAEKK